MAAGKYDFSIEQGSSFKIDFVYKDQNKQPVNLTNWCVRLAWKTNTGTTQAFSSDNTNYALYTLDVGGANGKISFMLPANITSAFNFDTAKYDLDLQSPDDFSAGGDPYVKRLLYGTITLIKRFSATSTDNIC